ncbi:hypothetical protein [Alsobacter soli]|uniref:hypothetical protein n=1 Tax=Alsobacter soli TaxID=2109933 RepID=UPI0011B1F4F4|nr:hypothetical protein [Alsobacter soli]
MTDVNLGALKALREEVHLRLQAQSSDYRSLIALDSAIRSAEAMTADPEASDTSSGAHSSALDLAGRVTQLEAAQRALQVRGEPLPIDELLQLVPAFGGRPGTRASLSSSLSQSVDFRSVRFNNRWCWWLTKPPPQAEADKVRSTQASGPARSSRWRQSSRAAQWRGRNH